MDVYNRRSLTEHNAILSQPLDATLILLPPWILSHETNCVSEPLTETWPRVFM